MNIVVDRDNSQKYFNIEESGIKKSLELGQVEIFLYGLIREFEKTDKSILVRSGVDEREITNAIETLIDLDLIVSFEENQKVFFKVKKKSESRKDKKVKMKKKEEIQEQEILKDLTFKKQKSPPLNQSFEQYMHSNSFFSYNSAKLNYVSTFIPKLAKKFNPVVIKRKRARIGRRIRRIVKNNSFGKSVSRLEQIISRSKVTDSNDLNSNIYNKKTGILGYASRSGYRTFVTPQQISSSLSSLHSSSRTYYTTRSGYARA